MSFQHLTHMKKVKYEDILAELDVTSITFVIAVVIYIFAPRGKKFNGFELYFRHRAWVRKRSKKLWTKSANDLLWIPWDQLTGINIPDQNME